MFKLKYPELRILWQLTEAHANTLIAENTKKQRLKNLSSKLYHQMKWIAIHLHKEKNGLTQNEIIKEDKIKNDKKSEAIVQAEETIFSELIKNKNYYISFMKKVINIKKGEF